jgi:hypothetical protein
MYNLPRELQSKIYSYDSTYYEIFEDCLFDIRNKLYVTYKIDSNRKRSTNSIIEIYKIINIGKKYLTPDEYNIHIKKTYEYIFLVDMYYTMEYNDFVNFYKWFYRNKAVYFRHLLKMKNNYI